MVCFDRIVCVLLGDVTGAWQPLVERPWVGGRAVGGHFGRWWTVLQRLGEELPGGFQITLFGDQDVDDLAELVDRSVQVNPSSRNFDVVRSTRSALPVFLLVGFSGPPPEPDVPVGRASGSPQVPLGGMFPSRTDRPRAGDLCSPV
jgi:hypothetical protein